MNGLSVLIRAGDNDWLQYSDTQNEESHGNMETFKCIVKATTVTKKNIIFIELILRREVVYKICQQSVTWFKLTCLLSDLQQ